MATRKKATTSQRTPPKGGRMVSPFIKDHTVGLLAAVFGNPGAGARFLIETWPSLLAHTLGQMAGLFTEEELRQLGRAKSVKPGIDTEPGSLIPAIGMSAGLLTKVSKLGLLERIALEQWIAGGGLDSAFEELQALKPVKPGKRAAS